MSTIYKLIQTLLHSNSSDATATITPANNPANNLKNAQQSKRGLNRNPFETFEKKSQR